MRALVLFCLVALALGLSGCGKKGSLEMPPAEPASSTNGNSDSANQ